MHVYVIYDVELSSIVAIFKSRKDAKKAMAQMEGDFLFVMKIPFGKTFEIDPFALEDNPDYLCD